MSKQNQFKSSYARLKGVKGLTTYTLLLLVLVLITFTVFAWFTATVTPFDGTVSMASISANVVLFDDELDTNNYLRVLGQQSSFTTDTTASMYNYGTYPVNGSNTYMTNYLQITNTCELDLKAYVKYLFTYDVGADDSFFDYYYFLITDITDEVLGYSDSVDQVAESEQGLAMLTLYNQAYSETFASNVERVSSIYDSEDKKVMSDLRRNSQICPEIISMDETRYFRIDFCCYDMPSTSVDGVEFSFSSLITLKQKDAPGNDGEDVDEGAEDLSSSEEFLRFISQASNGQTIRLATDIKVEASVTITSRLNIDLNGHTLEIAGDLVYETMSAGKCYLDASRVNNDYTYSQLLIGGNLTINMPNAEFKIIGIENADNIVLNYGTTRDEVAFTANCVRDTNVYSAVNQDSFLAGLVLENAHLVIMESSISSRVADVYLDSNTRLELTSGSSVANVYNVQGAHDIEIVNKGTICQINLSTLQHSGSTSGDYYEIEIYNEDGTFTSKGENLSAAILLPSWSVGLYSASQNPSFGTPNTYVYTTVLDWYVRPTSNNSFTQNDIVRSGSSVDLVTFISKGEYRISLKDTDYVEETIHQYLTQYFLNVESEGVLAGDSVETITSLTIYTYDEVRLGNVATSGDYINDWEFMRTRMTSLSILNLAFAELANDEIPDGAFDGKTSLEIVTLPTSNYAPNGYAIGDNAFRGTSIKEINLSSLCTAIGTDAFKVGNELSVDQLDWLVINWTDTSAMSSSLLNALNVDRTVVFMRTSVYNAFRQTTERDSTWFYNVYEAYSVKVEDAVHDCIYYLTTVSGNTVKVVYYSGAIWDGTVNSTINSNYNVVEIGQSAYYHAFRIDDKASSTVCNLSQQCTSIGADAFRNGNFASLNLGGATYVGDYAFEGASITTVSTRTTVNVTYLGEYAFSNVLIGAIGSTQSVLDLSATGNSKLAFGQGAFENATVRNATLIFNNLENWQSSLISGATFSQVTLDLTGTTTISALSFVYTEEGENVAVFDATYQEQNNLYLYNCYNIQANALNGVQVNELGFGIVAGSFTTQAQVDAVSSMGDGESGILVNSQDYPTAVEKVIVHGWLPQEVSETATSNFKHFLGGANTSFALEIGQQHANAGSVWNYFVYDVEEDDHTVITNLTLDETVTSIGHRSFGNVEIQNTQLDLTAVESYDEYAFDTAVFPYLTEVIFSDTEVSARAFAYSTFTILQTLDLTTVNQIGAGAFYQAKFPALTRLDLSNTNTIGAQAFYQAEIGTSNLLIDATDVLNMGTNALGVIHQGLPSEDDANSGVVVGISDQTTNLSACNYDANLFYNGQANMGFTYFTINGGLPQNASRAFAGFSVGDTTYQTIDVANTTSLPEYLFSSNRVGALNVGQLRYMTNVTLTSGGAVPAFGNEIYSYNANLGKFEALVQRPDNWNTNYFDYFTTMGSTQLSLGEATFGGILWNDTESGWWERFFTHVDALTATKMFAYGKFSNFSENTFALNINLGEQAFFNAEFSDLEKLIIVANEHNVTILDDVFANATMNNVQEIDVYTDGYTLTIGNQLFHGVSLESLATIAVTTNTGVLTIGDNMFDGCTLPVTSATFTTGASWATIGDNVFANSSLGNLTTFTLTSGEGALTIDGYLFGEGANLSQLQTLTVTTASGAVTLQGLINQAENLTSLLAINIITGSTEVAGINAGTLTISETAIVNVTQDVLSGLERILVQPSKGAIYVESIADGITFNNAFDTLQLASSTYNTNATLTLESGVLYDSTATGLTQINFAVNSSNLIVNGTFQGSTLLGVQNITAQINSTGSLTLADGLFESCDLTALATCDLAGCYKVGNDLFKNATFGQVVNVDLRNVLQVGAHLFESSGNVTLGNVYVGINDASLKAHALQPQNHNYDCFYGLGDGTSANIFGTTARVTIANLVVDGELPTYNSAQMFGLTTTGGELNFTQLTITENCSQLPNAVFFEQAGQITISQINACISLENSTLRTTTISIGDNAFKNVTINGAGFFANLSDNITSIGASAFEGVTIQDTQKFNFVNLTTNGTAIGNGAFKGATLYTSEIEFRQGTTLGESAFEGATFNNAVTVTATALVGIGARVFAQAELRANSSFDFTLTTTIGDELFSQALLRSGDTANSVAVNMVNIRQLGKHVFYNTDFVSTLTLGITTNTSGAYYASAEGGYTIFGGTTTIGTVEVVNAIPTTGVENAFGIESADTQGRLTINTVLISNAVKTLPDQLFAGATSRMKIGTLQLGDSVNVISEDFAIGQQCFYQVSFESFAIYFANDYTADTIIESYAFQGSILGNEANQNTTFATLLSQVTEIQANAFDGATAYFGGGDVTIVDASIRQNAFTNATLSNVGLITIENTTLETNAFNGAIISGPTASTFDLVITNGTTISESCFAGATLTRIGTISVDDSTIASKGFANVNASSATLLTLTNVGEIGSQAFYQANLESVATATITTADKLGDSAFEGANFERLTTLQIQDVPVIGTAVFTGATLTSLAQLSIVCDQSLLDSKATAIGDSAFANLTLTSLSTLTLVNYETIGNLAFYNTPMGEVTTFTLTLESGYVGRIGNKAFANAQFESLTTAGLAFDGYQYIGNSTEDSYVFANAFKGGIDLDLTDARVIGKYSFASCQLGTVTMGNQTYANGGEYSWGGGHAIFAGIEDEGINYNINSTIAFLDVVAPMPTSAQYVFGADIVDNMVAPTYTTVRFGETVNTIPDYAFNAKFDPEATAQRTTTVTIGNLYLMYQPNYNNGEYFYLGNATHAAKFMDSNSMPSNWVFTHMRSQTAGGILGSGSTTNIVFYVATVDNIYVPAGCVDDYEKSALGSYYCTANNVTTGAWITSGNRSYITWGSGTYFAFVSANRDNTPSYQNKFNTLSTASGDWTFTILNGNEVALVSYEGTGDVTIPAIITSGGTTYTVVEVLSSVLQGTTATTVTIGANVRTIGIDGISSTIKQFNVNNNARFSASYYYQIDTTTGNGNNANTTTTFGTFDTPQTNTNRVTYTLLGCALYNGDGTTLIRYAPGSTATEFTVPSTVRVVGSYAFDGVTLTTLTFEANTMLFLSSNAFRTTTIQNYLFQGTTAPILAGEDVFYMYRSININASPSAYTYTTAYSITVESATAYNAFMNSPYWSILAPIMDY